MNFIIDKQQYLAVKEAWRHIEEKSSVDHVIYNVLRGFEPNRGFSPVQSKIKLANGFTAWQSFASAKRYASNQMSRPVVYSGEKSERTQEKMKTYAAMLTSMGTRYGVEFTPELTKKINEELAK